MDIRTVILGLLDKNGQVKSSEAVKLSGFSRAYVNRYFRSLRDEGKIVLLGKANKAYYIPATQTAVKKAKQDIKFAHRILENKNLQEHEVLNDIKKTSVIFQDISENVALLVEYAFTEILNNAIEHSQSAKIEVIIEKDQQNISFRIIDKGVGIFNNIMEKRGLNNALEAIQDLLKGKQSTAPQTHSGEGIFFTSKIADNFIIQSGSKKLIFSNLLDDIFIKNIKNVLGTKALFSISCDSNRQLSEIFKQYTDETFSFNKTEVKVRLYQQGVAYISRSQARRILSGLDKFKKIILDFERIDNIGQGFADEIFRVWHARYPQIKIETVNSDENVQFMINRAKAGAG
ncbi:MAG: DUF4325 domain-containing protein [Candidatus Omnitrophota bacterium]